MPSPALACVFVSSQRERERKRERERNLKSGALIGKLFSKSACACLTFVLFPAVCDGWLYDVADGSDVVDGSDGRGKTKQKQSGAMPAHTLLRMATINGAKALGTERSLNAPSSLVFAHRHGRHHWIARDRYGAVCFFFCKLK